MSGALICRACGTSPEGDARFCADCGLPLVQSDHSEGEVSELRERARKVQSRYTQGELITVAAARNQPEAEFLQNMLLEEGIPSLVRRTGGFDVPDFLAAGARNVLVPASAEEAARELLGPAGAPVSRSQPPATPWVKVMAVVLVAIVVGSVAGAVVVSVLR